jgi:hypothetical protein
MTQIRCLPENPALAATSVAFVFGIMILVVLSAGQEAAGWPPFFCALGVLTIVAAAGFAAGGLVGFVFGIPRIPNGNGAPESKSVESGSSGPNGNGSLLHNSNLVQVSDWLTKILLGAGLTQMGQIGSTLGSIAQHVTADTGVDTGYIAPLIVYFVVLGFLSVYVWTITSFTGIISRSLREEVSAVVQSQVSGLVTEITHVKQEAKHQNQAWLLIETQLNRESREQDTPVAEIKGVLARLEQPDLVQIFHHVRRIRHSTWQRNKGRMARTMPIFQALIDLDPEERFHRSHAQLGYCHKDKLKPDYVAAISCLTKAIEIRNRDRIRGWTIYEFNRALCRIALDREHGGASNPEVQDAILADLREAAAYDQLGSVLNMPEASPIEVLSGQEDILLWCHENAERVRRSQLAAILDSSETGDPVGRIAATKVD